MNRNYIFKTLFAIGIILVVLGGYLYVMNSREGGGGETPLPEAELCIDIECIDVEVALTPEARVQGLSGREELLQGWGLLFPFEKEGYHGIWMKDMNFPIDIIWLDEAYRVVHIEERIAPDTFPTIFTPSAPVWNVLELPAGDADRLGIEIDDIFESRE